MKKLFLLLTIAIAASCATEVHQSNVLDVVPYPNEVQVGEGVFNAKGAAVTYSESLDEASANVIKAFADQLTAISGAESVVTAGTAEAVAAVKELIISGEWDVFSGVKLEIAADGTVTKVDAPLMDNAGNEIVAAGGASVEDGVITGTMNYYVAGVQEA